MENNNQVWVAEKMAGLDPPAGWNPDTVGALAGIHNRRPSKSAWYYWATPAALFVSVLMLFPAARAAAQQLWQFLTVRRIAFVRVNPWPKGIPAPEAKLIGTMVPPIPANDVDQARWRVHYDPRLPHAGVLSGNPRLSTTFGLSAGTVIKTAVLQNALQAVGITNVTIPPQWDNAQLTLHTSAVVIAEWPDIIFAQSLPLTMTAPPGFDFPAFSAVILRVLGVKPAEAQRLATQMGTTPAWIAPIDRDFDKFADIEEIQLASGPATLVQEKANDGSVDRLTLVWSVPDRVYVISGKLSRELAVATANAVQ
jgi:hypothetical protein